jgi:hypothetical protein
MLFEERERVRTFGDCTGGGTWERPARQGGGSPTSQRGKVGAEGWQRTFPTWRGIAARCLRRRSR